MAIANGFIDQNTEFWRSRYPSSGLQLSLTNND
jgi:hypothetical protein